MLIMFPSILDGLRVPVSDAKKSRLHETSEETTSEFLFWILDFRAKMNFALEAIIAV